jgi:hypothetical protein
VLALGHLRARFRSGVILDTEIGWLTRCRDALVVWCDNSTGNAPLLVTDAVITAIPVGAINPSFFQ